MIALPHALGPWHEFYGLAGTASATLIGLLFVAASVGAGIYSPERPHTVRAFLSSSVVHFSCVLVSCLLVLAPIADWDVLGGLVMAEAAFGLIYAGLIWRTLVRTQLATKLDLSDRLCYAQLPTFGYAALMASGAAFSLRLNGACAGLALATGMLLLVGVRNAWDITIWAVTKRTASAHSAVAAEGSTPEQELSGRVELERI